MEKSSSQIFSDKVKRIYEYNKKSPLFVRAAYLEIENDNIDDAVFILRQGLKLYPENPIAILLLARANALMGKKELAGKLIKKGSNIIHSKETYNFYMEELVTLEKQATVSGLQKNKIFFNENADSNEADNFVLPAGKESEEDKPEEIEAIENRLEQLAKTIASAKLPPPGDEKNIETGSLDRLSENNLIVSETLAQIYVSQGQYNEAIKVFKNLIKMKPGKTDHYSEKIEEIESKFIV
ncbi:MAG: tetratricopeptide repeat protein [Ignavibacteriaceae bacterium]